MRFDPSAVEGPYLRDILAQPGALADTVAGLSDAALPDLRGFDQIVLTGMGASFHALCPLQMQLVEHGLSAVAYETSELIYYFPAVLTSRTLLIAVSQSGRSVEMVRLLDMAAQQNPRPRIVGVTNTADSPLATRADHLILTQAGAESTVSCKTFVATLAALEWLGAAFTGGDRRQVESTLRQAAPLVEDYLRGWEGKVAELAEALSGVRDLFITGRGRSMAAAGAGGLIMKEAAHFHAEGMTCSAFRHGSFEMSGPGVFVLVFEGEAKTAALNRKLVADVCQAGGGSALVGPSSELGSFGILAVADAIRPVLEIVPIQMVSLALASLAGHRPGVFRLLTKVTTVE